MVQQLADHDTATFHNPTPLGSFDLATEGGEATHWPGLREIERGVGQRGDSKLVEATDWLRPPEHKERASSTTTSPTEPYTREVTPLIRLRGHTTPARRFQVLQQWEGMITRVDDEWFEADLRDLRAPKNPTEIAEFPLAEISPADKPLIRPGCVFYWVIGYETRSGGQITNTSEIRVRRAPQWTQRQLKELKVRAQELFTLEGEDGETTTQAERSTQRG